LLRLADLASALPDHSVKLFLVAPGEREKDVQAKLKRPSVQAANRGTVLCILFSDLAANCDNMCRFGSGRDILDKIAKTGV
jgi:type II restriction enzyme